MLSARTRDSLAPLAVSVAIFAAVMLAYSLRAHAAAVDPIATATSSIDSLAALISTYGWTVGSVVVAYAIVQAALRWNESQHWIAQGRALAWIASGLAVGGTALQALLSGAPWTGVIVTAVIAVVHLFDARTVAPAVGPSLAARAGTLSKVALLALTVAACATLKADAVAIEAGVVTCAKGDKPAATALGLQLGTEALADLLAGRTEAQIWTHVSADAEAASKVQGIAVASCAFGGLVADLDKLLHPAPAAGVATQGLTASAAVDPLAGGRAALAAFATAHRITRIDP